MEKTTSESSGSGEEQKTTKEPQEESPIMVVAVRPGSDAATNTEPNEKTEPKEKAEKETTDQKHNKKGTSSRTVSPSLRDASPMVMNGNAKSEKEIEKEKKEAADKLRKSYSDLSHEIKDRNNNYPLTANPRFHFLFLFADINPTEIITKLDKELGEINDETENLDIVLSGLSLCTSSILSNTRVDEHEECVRAKNKFFKNVFLMLLTVPNDHKSVQQQQQLIKHTHFSFKFN